MKPSHTKGFTIIELIFAVGVIGMIIGIVIPRMLTARIKAQRAAVQTSLWSYRTEAQNYWNTNKAFGTSVAAVSACPLTGDTSSTFLDSLSGKMASFATKINTTFSCYVSANGAAYAMYAFIPLESDPAIRIFCIDSSGYFGFRSTPDITDANCL